MATSLSRVASVYMVLLILVILLGSAITTVKGDYLVNVSQRGVVVRISGDLRQGVPNPPTVNTSDPFGRLPVFHVNLENTNVSSFTRILNKALRERTPTASMDQVTLGASSNGTYYHYDLGFDVTGIATTYADTVTLDMSWRSFVSSDDYKAGNYSINTVVLTYLQDRILQLAQLTSSPPSMPGIQHSLRWWWNDQVVDRRQAGELAADASMFNFTSLGLPLEKWKVTPYINSATMIFEARSGFNLTLADQIKEVTETGTIWTNAVYNLKATINAPWGAVASGDNLILEGQVPWSIWLMLGSILGTGILLTGTVLLERRIRGSELGPRHKRS